MELYDFTNLIQVLQEYANEVVDTYKNELHKDGHKATGKLISSVHHIFTINSNSIQVDLSLEDYWKYVEKGRKAGKMPPINKILDWIKIKPVIPRPFNGKLPTQKQLAYLISRKIGREGIEAGNELTNTLQKTNNKWLQRIEDALDKDLGNLVEREYLYPYMTNK